MSALVVPACNDAAAPIQETKSLDSEVVEFALLLPRWQALALLSAAQQRGISAAQMLRRMIVSTVGSEPPIRYTLENGTTKHPMPHLRDLPAEIRRLGERGMTVVRFKGLGEMNAEELWETTLDPAKRTLLRVKMEDALKAEEMFRTLMGEKVEPRREFIQKHALEVKEIDYHGA